MTSSESPHPPTPQSRPRRKSARQINALLKKLGKDTVATEEDDSKPKIKGSLAALQNNSGTLRVYDYRETSGDGKVIHSFSKGSKSVKGRAK